MRQILQWQKAKGFHEFTIRDDVRAENKENTMSFRAFTFTF